MGSRGNMLVALIVATLFTSQICLIEGEEAAGGSIFPDMSQCINVDHECPNDNISYWLFTRANAENPFQLKSDNIKSAPYDHGAPFVVLIHGYTGYRDYSPNMELRPALLAQGKYNIISLDWGALAKEPCYFQAAYNVKTVANCTTRFLLDMMDEIPDVINMDNLHVIGFSLGAQVAGNIGGYFKSIANRQVKWMTAMDPALPFFDTVTVKAENRINPDDALFLDVYHTDAGNKGVVRPVGKVDFYMNSGFSQPGCGSNRSCDHVRSVMYYAETIDPNSKGFWGAPCEVVSAMNYLTTSAICEAKEGAETTQKMGYYIPHTVTGTYQVMTNKASPFALGKNPAIERPKRSSLWEWIKDKF